MKSQLLRNSITISCFYALVMVLLGVYLPGCLSPELKELNPCLVSAVQETVDVERIDKVDLLFVVDNSGSMIEEQQKLRDQFPRLIEVLTTGDKDGNGSPDFPPATDLHLAVVSTDMGAVGILAYDGCGGQGQEFGDDGIMQHAPSTDPGLSCAGSYPTYLSYLEEDDPFAVANSFNCIATLGIEGCGFEQPLEAALKALWPSTDSRIKFYTDANGNGILGHGDMENAGFLRNGNDNEPPSLLAIIIVSDEEDCSSHTLDHLANPDYLPPDHPLTNVAPELRCPKSPQNRFDLDRYIKGFKALREGREKLVVFAAIVGVPKYLVDEVALQKFDTDWKPGEPVELDDEERNNFYNTILADGQMQEVSNEVPFPETNLIPSCTVDNTHYDPSNPDSEKYITKAYPPRRIVEVARGFGPRGLVQSICQDSFAPAMNAIIDIISKQLRTICLPHKLPRNYENLVDCHVIWNMPEGMDCTDPKYSSFLSDPKNGNFYADDGRRRCQVNQLAVVNPNASTLPEALGNTSELGWYYDDFSMELKKECLESQQQRIAFRINSKIGQSGQLPGGVTVKLECVNREQSLVGQGSTAEKIGKHCHGNDAECRDDPTVDATLFCHHEKNLCVMQCISDADCPAAWVCDTRESTILSAGNSICVNPTCSEEES